MGRKCKKKIYKKKQKYTQWKKKEEKWKQMQNYENEKIIESLIK